MAMTSREKNEAYRQRMYEAGYKRIFIWVPRRAEGAAVKMERKAFMSLLEELTAGWSKARLSKFLAEIMIIIKKKLREDERKKKK